MQKQEGSQGPGPSSDSVDNEDRAYRDRLQELVKTNRMDPRDAAHRVRVEQNADLVKMNAAAQTQQRPAAAQPAVQAQQPAKETPRRASTAASGPRYGQGDMATNQTDAAREHAERARRLAAQQQSRQTTPAAAKPLREEPQAGRDGKEMTDKGQRQPRGVDHYRELRNLGESQQASRGNPGQGRTR